jgi:hypothetical protein
MDPKPLLTNFSTVFANDLGYFFPGHSPKHSVAALDRISDFEISVQTFLLLLTKRISQKFPKTNRCYR